ncbi:MAG: PAS domain-containing protein [Aerococcus sp.]|nr:PAS domain-containing protein [Aerococcus sp.]
MNQQIIETYKSLTRFLGKTLGPNYEVVLHVIDDDEGAHIEEIVNGYISGRTVDSPLTSYALDRIQSRDYLYNDYDIHYKVLAKPGHEVYGSTFYIKDGDELLGLLCINADQSQFIDKLCDLLRMMPGGSQTVVDYFSQESSSSNAAIEVLSSDMSEVIRDSVGEVSDLERLESGYSLTKAEKMAIMRKLKARGIFNMKGAIPKVAEFLTVSEPTVYRYLNEIVQEKQDKVENA